MTFAVQVAIAPMRHRANRLVTRGADPICSSPMAQGCSFAAAKARCTHAPGCFASDGLIQRLQAIRERR